MLAAKLPQLYCVFGKPAGGGKGTMSVATMWYWGVEVKESISLTLHPSPANTWFTCVCVTEVWSQTFLSHYRYNVTFSCDLQCTNKTIVLSTKSC